MQYPWENPAAWHAINVHMPVALAMLGIPLACLVAITRGGKPWLRWGTVALYALLIISALMAVQSGEGAMDALPVDASQVAWDQVDTHESMAEKVWIFASVTLALLLVTAVPRKSFRQIGSTLATVASVVTGVWVMLVGHAGGVLVYEYGMGVPARDGATTQPVVAVATTSPSPTTNVAAVAPTHAGLTTDAGLMSVAAIPVVTVSFTKQIKPIIEEKCLDCHSADEPKGEYDMTSLATMTLAGRKSGIGVVPHKPTESSIIAYLTGEKKPRMPKGDDPLTPEQIQLFRDWIASGAPDDSTGAPAVETTIVVADVAASAVEANAAPTTTPAATQPATAPSAVETAAAATTSPSTAPTAEVKRAPEVISPNWEPNVAWNENELVAIRRYIRLQFVAPPPPVPQVEATINNPVDAFIVSQWKNVSGPTAGAIPELTDDATFVRRIYLDLIGVIPSADEARAFVEDKAPDKRPKLIDALLNRSEDYAAHWVPFWEDALCSNGNHQGGVGTHGDYRAWLLKNFKENKPFDLMVTELLDPTMPNNPGRYVLNQDHTRTIQSAADTAQVFMGTAIKCASCHNHFENQEWPQKRAAAFAGFFGPTDLELIRCERKSGEFVPTSFLFDLPEAPKTAPVDDQNARLKRVAQMVVDPTNPRFAPTIVNRLWKRYFGLAISEPVDDYRDDRALNHSPLLAWLAHDFILSGYDVKHTIRLIVNSRTYQLKYDPALEDTFDVAKQNEPRYYRSPSLRRLTAEQLLDSIAAATGEAPSGDARTYADDRSTVLTRALGKPASRNEVSTARPEDTAVVQALELLNGPEYFDRIYKGTIVSTLSVVPEPAKIVERLYWTVLNRAPVDAEVQAAEQFIANSPETLVTAPFDFAESIDVLSLHPQSVAAALPLFDFSKSIDVLSLHPQPPAARTPVELVWIDDAIPAGATARGAWQWSTPGEPAPFSGKRAHTLGGPVVAGARQHLFMGAKFAVSKTDTLFAYVYLDPSDPPTQIMLQYHVKGGDWNRAAWGEAIIPFQPQVAMGALPAADEWVRLEIPAEKIGLTGDYTDIDGISFDQAGGRIYWDKIGVVKRGAAHDPAIIGDMVWALVTSPEFQYVR